MARVASSHIYDSFLPLFRRWIGYRIPRLHSAGARRVGCSHQPTGIRFLAGVVVPFDRGVCKSFQAGCGRKIGANRRSCDVEFLRSGYRKICQDDS